VLRERDRETEIRFVFFWLSSIPDCFTCLCCTGILSDPGALELPKFRAPNCLFCQNTEEFSFVVIVAVHDIHK
jgi:hypothetical protein